MRWLLCSVLLASPAIAARTSAPPDAQALAASAHQVVHATVDTAETRRIGPKILTTYTLQPMRTLAGPSAASSFEVVLPGGRVGDVLVEVHGVPVWQVGDQVIVFRQSDGHVGLDGALTLEDEHVVDALAEDRALPTTLPELSRVVSAAMPEAPRPE